MQPVPGTLRLRLGVALGALCAVLVLSLAASSSRASAAVPEKTDVMIIFDTSGSMGPELTEAEAGINEVVEHLKATLPNSQFGVSNVEDFPEYEEGVLFNKKTEKEYEEDKERPWHLDQTLTPEVGKVTTAIDGLSSFENFAHSGGDAPEAYGRALWETATNPTVKWREGARHLIVLVADNVPHDHELDEGLASAFWLQQPFNTGEEQPGKWGIAGTQWNSGSPTEFHSVLAELKAENKSLEMVDFEGEETHYIPYWEYWAAQTGGQATAATNGKNELSSKLITLTEAGAAGSFVPCPTGKARGVDGVCFNPPPTPPPPHSTLTQVICNLVVATATDTCTATVADASAPTGPNPTGLVSFASSTGGVFPAGATCVLVRTPLSSNVSSCAVQFLPPTTGSTLPDITASYGGDSEHAGSSGSTHYPPLSELAKDVTLASLGTINGATIEIGVSCGFACAVVGELFSGPSLATLSSAGTGTIELAEAASKHKKSHKPKLLGKGAFTLNKAGNGKLVIKVLAKYRHVLSRVRGSVHLTLKLSTKTAGGSLVGKKTVQVTLKPRKKKTKH